MQMATTSSQRRVTLGWLPDLAWAIGREILLATALQLVVFAALVVINILSGATPSKVSQAACGFYVYVLFKAVQAFKASRSAARS